MTQPAPTVSLREIKLDSLRAILKLGVSTSQEDLVADNATSIAQAHFDPKAWFRGIYSGDEAVGFVMLSVDTAKAEYDLWRLMIGSDHQGKGYGRRAIQLIIEHVRALPGARELTLHVVEAPHSARPLYEALGFQATGKVEDGEAVMRLVL